MPVVTIDMWPGRDKETKKKLIQNVTKAVAESIGCPENVITIVINEQEKDNWGIAGEQASDKFS